MGSLIFVHNANIFLGDYNASCQAHQLAALI